MIFPKTKTIKKHQKNVLIFLLCCLSFFLFTFHTTHAARQMEGVAFITDKTGQPVTGNYAVRFAIYSQNRNLTDPYPSDSDQTQRIWTETQTIQVKSGILQFTLGANQDLPILEGNDNNQFYLGIRINQDAEMAPRKKITSIQTNLATAGSQINLLSAKINSASTLLSQNSQPTQVLPFYEFKTESSELSSPLENQTIENNQFSGTYNSPENFQELNLQLHEENQLDLEDKDQSQTYLVYDVFMEDPTKAGDFHTELGNQMDQKELEWNRPNHPNFIAGWNEVRLSLVDGIKTGEIDWQHLNYFRAYFKFQTNTNLKFKNIRIETKAKYQPLAQTLNTQNLDLWDNTDQGTALKSIFTEFTIQTQANEKLNNQIGDLSQNVKTMQEQMALLQDQTKAIINFSLALNLGNVIYRDTLGNMDIMDGKITAKDIEVLSTIKARDIEATNSLKGQNIELGGQVSGANVIKSGQLVSTKILTTEAKAGIKLYITPKGSTQGKLLYYDEGDVEPGVGFTVKIDAPALDRDVEFNWLIVK